MASSATKKKPVKPPSTVTWTEQEAELGREILAKARKRAEEHYGAPTAPNREAQLNLYAEVAQVRRYTDVPQGVRSFISFAARKKGAKKAKSSADKPLSSLELALPSIELEWWKKLASNETFRHGILHPEDESNLVEWYAEVDAATA